jgi:multicomponent Na+:H+ antiporter subunit E
MFLLNIVLAVAWMLLRDAYGPADFLTGFLIGFGVTILTERALRLGNYGHRTWRALELIGFSAWGVVRANIALITIILMPVPPVQPGIVGVPIDLRSDAAITLLAYLISLTPGTTCLDVSGDRRTIYVHTIYVSDAQAFQRVIKRELEQRIARVFAGD